MGRIVEKIHKICPQCGKEYYVRPCEDKRYTYCSVACRKSATRTYKTCIACGKNFYVYKDRKDIQNYCSAECKNSDLTTTKPCKYCGKEITTWKSQASRYTYCSIECRTKDKNTEYNCDYCGKLFTVLKSKVEKNKAGVFCSHKCSTDASIHGKYIKCLNCGKNVYRVESGTYRKSFCSNACHGEYSRKRINKTCEYCGKEYEVKLSQSNGARFCSNNCKNKWQSENNIGENHPIYSAITMPCDYCGKQIEVKRYKMKNQIHHFCSYDCTHKFYKIIENRTEKQRITDHNVAINAIKYVNPSLTEPHKIVLKMLNEMNVYLRIEELINYYKLDVYIPNNNLAIEINGDYWHCSPIRYKNIPYQKQFERISSDKSKHTYVKNKYGYELLYLWERDIMKNPEVCRHLIDLYIAKKGILKNYNSFNYHLENNVLILNDDIIYPYQEQDINDYRHLIKFKQSS